MKHVCIESSYRKPLNLTALILHACTQYAYLVYALDKCDVKVIKGLR